MAKNKRKNGILLDASIIARTLAAYDPWWSEAGFAWNNPAFKRDVFLQAISHIESGHGMALLINGPRRVGKTTIMRQLIEHLLKVKKIAPAEILFFSLDDPLVQQLPQENQGEVFERIMEEWEAKLGKKIAQLPLPVYCFLDEVQRLPHWELYIKRYVDLKYPIRFVISGSASHTIFRKSLESLLGRLVDISLPPFSFREWIRFHYGEYAAVCDELAGAKIDIADKKIFSRTILEITKKLGAEKTKKLNELAGDYARDGGFPQLWEMKDLVERAQFIDLQFVKRVTLEDLRLVREVRRPEIFHQFLRYVFARTGEEYNLEELAGKIHTTRPTLTDALPLLLQTELIRKVERFANKPVRLRSTHAKLYAADTVLYEAITKMPADLNGEDKGRLAETLAFNMLRRLPGISDICYFRTPDGKHEVDFILKIGKLFIPVEIKSGRANINESDHIRFFLKEYGAKESFGIMAHMGEIDFENDILTVPLGVFLLIS